MTNAPLKFAFDVDGLMLEMPQLFSAITRALKASGHKIYVVTDFDEAYRSYREEELARNGILYDELVITRDKEKFILNNCIDYAFDDDPEYYPNLHRLSFFAASKPK